MATSFTGAEFVKALTDGTLREAITKQGMVKPSENDASSIQFSEGMSCQQWITIPVELIEKVDFISNVRCGGHEHPFAQLVLKEPPGENKMASVLGNLLRAGSRARAIPPTSSAPSAYWACGCTGTCYDGTDTGVTGAGSSIAEAISDCQDKLTLTCVGHGGLKTYVGGSCSDVGSGAAGSAARPKVPALGLVATTPRSQPALAPGVWPKGTPAPATGYYVAVTVFSTGATSFYGPYSYEDAQDAFRALYNPTTQATGVPFVYAQGAKLQ